MMQGPQPMLRRVIGVFMNSVAAFALAAGANILMTRMLGPSERGAYSVALLLAATLVIVVDFGLRSALLYNVSRAQDKRAAVADGIAVAARLLVYSGGATAFLYAIVFAIGKDSFLQGVQYVLLGLSLCFCLVLLVRDIITMLFTGIRDFRGRNGALLVYSASLFLSVLIWSITGIPFKAEHALALQAFSCCLAVGAGVVYLHIRYRPKWSNEPDPGWKSRYLPYGLKSMSAQLAVQGNARLDTFVLNSFLGNKAVGIYSAAASIAELTQHVTNAAAVVLFPEIGCRSNSGTHRITLITLGASVSVVTLICLLLAAGMHWLVPTLFGPTFAPGIVAGIWLLPGMVGMTFFRILGAATSAHGKPEYRSYAALLGLVITLALDLVLIPRFGLVGAAWASSTAYLVLGAVMIPMYLYLARCSLGEFFVGLCVYPVESVRDRFSQRRRVSNM